MSPEIRPSRSAARKIRKLKKEVRNLPQTQEVKSLDQTPWEKMEQILNMRLPERKIADNSLIKAWFETRMETRDKSPQVQDEARTAFFKLHKREDLMAVRDSLAIITQTVR